MAMFQSSRQYNQEEAYPMREGGEMARPHRPGALGHPMPPPPPHMRRQMAQVHFEDRDLEVFREAFGDEDTAAAAVEILCAAPPEIQILAYQILHMIEKEVG